jgi:hypothetical protein
MTNASQPVLDLTTQPHERAVIRINGTDYPLKAMSTLGLRDYFYMQRTGPTVAALLEKSNLTVKEDQALSASLDELCRRVLEAPDAVHAALGNVHRMRIFAAFSRLLGPADTDASASPSAPASAAPRRSTTRRRKAR